MSLLSSIHNILDESPDIKAGAIAKRLDQDRTSVNSALHSNKELFHQNDDWTWRLQKPQEGRRVVRRIGPFGPAKDLIPKDQQLEIVSADTPCHIAIALMVELNYSTLPVRGVNNKIVGVFTWKKFITRIHGLVGSNIQVTKCLDQTVEDYLDEAKFLDPELYIDTEVDWSSKEYVIVGTREDPWGILTISDVWAKLNDFAEAFVLLHEIEHDLRELIEAVAVDNLREWISDLTVPEGKPQPSSLRDFTFRQYYQLICEKSTRWPHFEPHLRQPRDLFTAEFTNVNDLRNEVMHFRGEPSASRCFQLRTFRDRTRKAIQRVSR